jgi:hypothetical protein
LPVASVLGELFHECPGPGRAGVLLYDRHVSQFPASRAPRFCVGLASRLALGGVLFQVELEFLLEFGFLVCTPQRPTQFSKERCHDPS